MKPRRLLETLGLAATAVCLIGHGGLPLPPPCMLHEGESRNYNVVGTCGPVGVVTVTWSPATFCTVGVTGDDVGLPLSGSADNHLDGGFRLDGSINIDWDVDCIASQPTMTDAGAPPPDLLTVACTLHPAPGNINAKVAEVAWCQAELLPVTSTCNLRACPTANCSSEEHEVFSPSGCCPTCVANGPNDVIPSQPPPQCHPETCPQTCPTGQEMYLSVDACCGTCQVPSEQCLAGRAEWRGEVAARWALARACAVEADCTNISIGSHCESTCIDAIAVDQSVALSQWAQARGNELCADCNTLGVGCSTNQSSRPICKNNTCVMMGP